MLTKLDRYIAFRFIGTFFFILALLMTISIVFDISEKVDDFIRTQPTIKEVLLDYYLNFIMYYGNLFSPLIIFIALIIFTSRMAQRSEIVAILSGGVSFNRLLRPFLLSATILAGMALMLNHFIVPHANKDRLEFEEKFIRFHQIIEAKNLHLEVAPGHIVYFHSIDMRTNTGLRLSMETWNQDKKLTQKLLSQRAVQDTSSGRWVIYDYVIRKNIGGKEQIIRGTQKDTILDFTLNDFGRRSNYVSSMDYYELDEFIAQETARGSDKIPFYEVEKHQRTSYPFATYVLTIIGVSVSSRKVRGGIGVQIAMGFLIILLYIFAMKVSTVSATNAGLDPLISTWLPNMVFSVLAVYLYMKARR